MIGHMLAIRGSPKYCPMGCLAPRHNDIGDIQFNKRVESAPEPLLLLGQGKMSIRYWGCPVNQAHEACPCAPGLLGKKFNVIVPCGSTNCVTLTVTTKLAFNSAEVRR